ncbi:MAG: hypothetical protein WCA37_01015 [Terracidiphilus sp.]
MSESPEDLGHLAARIDALEKRVHNLEHPEEAEAERAAALRATLAEQQEGPSVEQAVGLLPVLGRALLGIAGAYVLRAVVESGVLPPLPVAGLALAYTFLWVVWAERAGRRSAMAGGVYAITAVLILGPMLWELMLRFRTFPATVSAVVVSVFAAAAGAIAWRQARSPVANVLFASLAVMAVALAMATHALLPFVVALLVMALVSKVRILHGQDDWNRVIVALAVDAGIVLLLFIYSAPEAMHPEYPSVSRWALLLPGLVIFAMDAATVGWAAIGEGKSLRVWQTLQAMIAFVLAAASVLTFTERSGERILGAGCLALSLVCYGVSFRMFRRAEVKRNFRIFSAWSGGLLLGGMLWSLPAVWAGVGLSLAAIVVVVLSVRMECITLDLHGAVFLVASALAVRMPAVVLRAFSETTPAWPAASFLIVTLAALATYAVSRERPGEAWREQTLHLVTAVVAVCGVSALLVQGLIAWIAHAVTLSDAHTALMRTLSLCALALGLAFAGARWQRLEATRIAYAALVFMAVKLFYEDLRVGRMEFIAGSIFLFAVTLIAVPRMAHPRLKH